MPKHVRASVKKLGLGVLAESLSAEGGGVSIYVLRTRYMYLRLRPRSPFSLFCVGALMHVRTGGRRRELWPLGAPALLQVCQSLVRRSGS